MTMTTRATLRPPMFCAFVLASVVVLVALSELAGPIAGLIGAVVLLLAYGILNAREARIRPSAARDRATWERGSFAGTLTTVLLAAVFLSAGLLSGAAGGFGVWFFLAVCVGSELGEHVTMSLQRRA